MQLGCPAALKTSLNLPSELSISTSNLFKCATGETPPIENPVCDLTCSASAIQTSFFPINFFNLFNEHLLSPATKQIRKPLSALRTKLFTIAPTSQFKAVAASFAVLAVLSRTII